MAKAQTEQKYLELLEYLRETGLDRELQEVCRRHRVTMREVFFATHSKAAMIARLDMWHWLIEVRFKSHSEVARMFAREPTTVTKAMRRLHETAGDLRTALNREDRNIATAAAKVLALATKRGVGSCADE